MYFSHSFGVGFAGVCSILWSFSVCLAGISLVRLSGLFLRSNVILSVLSFAAFVIRSFALWPFIWSHGLCVPPLSSALSFLYVTVYSLIHK